MGRDYVDQTSCQCLPENSVSNFTNSTKQHRAHAALVSSTPHSTSNETKRKKKNIIWENLFISNAFRMNLCHRKYLFLYALHTLVGWRTKQGINKYVICNSETNGRNECVAQWSAPICIIVGTEMCVRVWAPWARAITKDRRPSTYHGQFIEIFQCYSSVANNLYIYMRYFLSCICSLHLFYMFI